MKIINPKCKKITIQKIESVILEMVDHTPMEQVWKIKEELTEVETELLNEKYRVGDRAKTIEELFDLKQAVETLIYLLYLPEYVKEYAPVHAKKMFKRFGGIKNDDM